jgi:DNA-3-methyladenine glycosylase
MGIHFSHSGISLLGDEIWIEDRGIQLTGKTIEATPRIGVDYAGEDAFLPYRFLLKEQLIRGKK